eukprot:274803_1
MQNILKYKELIAKEFNIMMRSDFAKQCIKQFGFGNYEFLIANESHWPALEQLYCDTYQQSNVFAELFDFSIDELKTVLCAGVKSQLDKGKCFIVIDKNVNTIVSAVCYADYYDNVYSVKHINDKAMNHALELFSGAHDEETLNKLSNGRYGVLCHGGSFIKNNEYKSNKYVAFFLGGMIANLMIFHCGYKYIYGEVTHENVAKMTQKGKSIILKELDFANHVFNDGTHINDYFNQLKLKKKYTNDKIQKK